MSRIAMLSAKETNHSLGTVSRCAIATLIISLLNSSPMELPAQDMVPVSSRRKVGWQTNPPSSVPNVRNQSFRVQQQQEEVPRSLPTPREASQQEPVESLGTPSEEQETIDPRNADAPPESMAIQAGKREVINQYYPDGKIQIRRYVVQDEIGNFLNDGSWQLYNQKQQVMARGEFRRGVMDGAWERWHPTGSPGLFSEAPYNQFKGPFKSQASFSKGKMNGLWTIYDRNDKKVHAIPYIDGARDGRAIWYLPKGAIFREVDFRKGTLHGIYVEYDEENKPRRKARYDDGQELITRKTFFHKNQPKDEKNFLGPKMNFVGNDDWWNATPAPFEAEGDEVQHGLARQWYSNGQIRSKGQFQNGKELGLFQWWHSNGTKQTQGEYKTGLKESLWVWWHANGRVAIKGEYKRNIEFGEWTWYSEAGRVDDIRDFSTAPNSSGNSERSGSSGLEEIDIGVPEDDAEKEPKEGSDENAEPPKEGTGETSEGAEKDA